MEWLFALAFWGFVLWVCWKWFLGKFIGGFKATKTAKAQIKARQISEEYYYEMAANEVQQNQIRPGLWAKAWSDVGGDETKAKALYLKLRVASMKDEAAKLIFDGMNDSAAVSDATSKVIVECPRCSQKIRVSAGGSGTIICTNCGGSFRAET